MKRINDLTLLTTLRAADELILRNSASGETSRVALATLFAIFGGVVESTYQLLWGLASDVDTGGTLITFERAFANTDYIVLPFSQDDNGTITVTLGTIAAGTKTAAGICVYPAVNNADIAWIAIGEKVS